MGGGQPLTPPDCRWGWPVATLPSHNNAPGLPRALAGPGDGAGAREGTRGYQGRARRRPEAGQSGTPGSGAGKGWGRLGRRKRLTRLSPLMWRECVQCWWMPRGLNSALDPLLSESDSLSLSPKQPSRHSALHTPCRDPVPEG
ncbi:unnamed protein product [Eretmochelys imbricata]